MIEKIVNALQIAERSAVLQKYYTNQHVEDSITTWLGRKSLCTKDLFYEALKIKDISQDTFNLGIKSLNEEDQKILYTSMGEVQWFKVFKDILASEEISMEPDEIFDYSYAFRFHGKYLYNQISILEQSYENSKTVVEHVMKDLLNIGAKTFVYDLHEYKDKNGLNGDTSEERFQSYLTKRFGSAECCKEFFCEYPVLGRLCVERMLLHMDNFKTFLDAIQDAERQLQDIFGLTKPHQVQILSMGDGDSHGGGKSVMTFQINKKKLVLKYKNLEIGNRLNLFLGKLEQYNSENKFYKVRRITKENYTIEEFVEHESCKDENEIKKYYHRFGEYIAICYLLCGNDFHYENIIAHGAYPVLIDVETIIQNDNPLASGESAHAKVTVEKYIDSVLTTGLLPTEFLSNRIEPPNKEVNSQSVKMSGLNGQESMLPFKMLKLKNLNTDEMKFEYMPHSIEEKGNIPLINGKKVNAETYYNMVIEGFQNQYKFFVNHKKKLLTDVKTIFSNIEVRNVIKATQKYADMLVYGYHPKCMKNYMEREKLFENIWSFTYVDKTPIAYEIEDMLVNDIPIFFNNTSKMSLITSKRKEIKNFYRRTAIDRVCERIEGLDEVDLEEQLKYMTIALDLYNGEISSYSGLKEVEDIVHHIAQRAIYGKENTVTWKDLFYYESWDYNNLPINLYNGVTGIYVLLLYYSKYYNNAEAKKLFEILDKMIFVQKGEIKSEPSIYTGEFSCLYPLAQRIKLFQNPSDVQYAIKMTQSIDDFYDRNSGNSNDWLDGKAGIIKVLVLFYQFTKEMFFINVARKIADKINISDTNLCGLAHGYSGIMIALCELYSHTEEKKYLEIIEACLVAENVSFNGEHWTDHREGKDNIYNWCHGVTGIGFARIALIQNKICNKKALEDLLNCLSGIINVEPENDCLCHGSISNLIFLESAAECAFVPDMLKKKICKKIDMLRDCLGREIRLEGFPNQPALGLMQGLTGVGFYKLMQKKHEVPNILLLE